VTPIAPLPKACWILQIVSAWGIPKFLTKLDAVSLLKAFCHLERNENAMNASYITSLSGSDASSAVARQQKMKHAHESLFYHCSVSPPLLHYLPRVRNIVGYFLDRHVHKDSWR
jgi:hypothetical protein